MAKNDEFEVPAGFPQNVNPTKENVKAFEDQRKADKTPKERVGGGLSDEAVAEPDSQSKTASK